MNKTCTILSVRGGQSQVTPQIAAGVVSSLASEFGESSSSPGLGAILPGVVSLVWALSFLPGRSWALRRAGLPLPLPLSFPPTSQEEVPGFSHSGLWWCYLEM